MEIHFRFAMHRDVPVIHQEKNKLDGLVIPAHILSFQEKATSVFVTSLPEKPYVIDPMTYIFQHSKSNHLNDKGELRASVKNMCEDYHPDLAEKLEALASHGSLTPNDLPACDELCENVLRFQLEKVRDAAASSGTDKYRQRYQKTRATLPRAVIPPYFHFDVPGDDWFQLSLDCAVTTLAISGKTSVAPVIFTPIAALTTTGIQRIVKDYGSFDHVFIWIDNYAETIVTAANIRAVRQFVKALAKKVTRVETLYGGYLMMMSGFDGLSGISHGILYTQHKSFKATPGAGGPSERYYIPIFRGFRSLSQTDLIFHKHPELMCKCSVCSDILDGNPDNIIWYIDNPELLRSHFLTVRRQEADNLRSSSSDVEVLQFRETCTKYHSSIAALPNPDAFIAKSQMSGLSYLNEWAEAFSSP